MQLLSSSFETCDELRVNMLRVTSYEEISNE